MSTQKWGATFSSQPFWSFIFAICIRFNCIHWQTLSHTIELIQSPLNEACHLH